MLTRKLALAECDPLSVTVAVKLKVPAADGVPEMEPFAARESPSGADPDHR